MAKKYIPSRLTVVPCDKTIILEGIALIVPECPQPEGIHAIQWKDGAGVVEYEDLTKNHAITETAYTEHLKPYIDAFNAQKAALEAEQQAIEEYNNSEEAKYIRLRAERDMRIAATDYLVLPDYTGLTDAQKAAVLEYRQALRDITSQEGAPWDGGGAETPWPVMPEL